MIPYGRKRSAQVVLASVGLLLLLGLTVATAYIHNVRWDLSTGDVFTLSDHARRVLDSVDRPLKVTAFIRTEDPRNPFIKDLLWQVSRENDFIDYKVIDINRHPALASEYGINAYGATVVEADGKRSDFGNPSESQLTAAILSVLQTPKRIHMLSGHGECPTDNTDRRVGCSRLSESLSMESYTVVGLELLGRSRVPDDVGVLMIVGPNSDLLEAEAAALRGYLDRGGKALVLLDPFRSPRLVSLLSLYGIEVGTNIVVDPDNRMAGGEEFSVVIADSNRAHLVSATLDAPPLFSLAAGIVARSDDATGRIATSLIKSGPRSWASYDPGLLKGGAVRFVAGRDRNGPISVGAEIAQPARDPQATEGARTRIIVYGDADFVTNRFLDYLGNKDLLLNSVNWLARGDRLIATRPQRKEGGTKQFFISQADGRSVFRTAVVIQPLLFLAVALVLFVRRRYGP